jgi:hypothetical protein
MNKPEEWCPLADEDECEWPECEEYVEPCINIVGVDDDD